ncbi:MAG: FAD-dependent oxidoreductase [bacterium]
MRIGVVGAGHAGVEAAAVAAAAGAQVTIFSAERLLPYFRPRIVALAFGQVEGAAIQIHPAQWYQDRGIRLTLDAPVEAISVRNLSITSRGREEVFDGIVLATGARPIVPSFAASAVDRVLPLWTASHADVIRGSMKPGGTVAIVGGGAIGIEAALRAAQSGCRAVVVEKASGLMSGRLAPQASGLLMERLQEKGIRILTGAGVDRAEARPGGVTLQLEGGTTIEDATAILCIGARSDVGLAGRAGIETAAGIVVDSRLRSSVPNAFACGDVAEVGGVRGGTALDAVMQGRVAGGNVCAAAAGAASGLKEYIRSAGAVSLKAGDFELHIAGRVGWENCEVQVLEGSAAGACRLLLVQGGRIVGVQMVGTNKDFRQYEAQIAGVH